ncbi:MAG TPA: cupredoxin domain-containing protein [Candidatus Limnocylindrales bacterium]|jgi:plastocyanin|nr:cupredoxin domain-containing protein [Candidatus Limnocylindrales bacterium]
MKPIRLSLLAVALAAVMAACGSTSGGETPTDPATADVTVTSVDMAFDPGTVNVPAGRTFTLALVNQDSMPHNVAIYTDESRSEKLFEGEMVTDGTITYEIPALDAGEYFFDCSLHPDMTGTLVAGD